MATHKNSVNRSRVLAVPSSWKGEMAGPTAAGGGGGVLRTVGVNVSVSVDVMGTCPAPLSPDQGGSDLGRISGSTAHPTAQLVSDISVCPCRGTAGNRYTWTAT
jgi:hypothetical protein